MDDPSFENDSSKVFTCRSENNTNRTDWFGGVDYPLDQGLRSIIYYTAYFLILCCVLSLVVNAVILSSVLFLRSKVLPTLYISLSLAAADTFAIFLSALDLGFVFLLPSPLSHYVGNNCLGIFILVIEMGAFLTTMFHLVLLAANHYLGVLRPLRYPVVMTTPRLRTACLLLWTLPSTILIVYVFLLQDMRPGCFEFGFLGRSRYRTWIAIPYYTAVCLVIFIYCHIYTLVTKRRDDVIELHDRPCPLRRHYSRPASYVRSQVNKKSIETTLMIVGSMVLGRVPFLTHYFLVCEDCPLSDVYFRLTYEYTVEHHCLVASLIFLSICKGLVNSFIYVCRMREIQDSLKEMKRKALALFGRKTQQQAA